MENLIGGRVARLSQNPRDELVHPLVSEVPHLAALDVVAENDWTPVKAEALGTGPLQYAVKDFYLTNPMARASTLMAELSANAAARARASDAASGRKTTRANTSHYAIFRMSTCT